MIEKIYIPCNSRRRSEVAFAKLLYRVEPQAFNGYDFRGKTLRPGSHVELKVLWPTPAYPPTPILLEGAGAIKPGWRRRCDQDLLYLLWRFDIDKGEWVEIARSLSNSWTWTLDLAPVAMRALRESRGCEKIFDYTAIARRIEWFVHRQLRRLPEDERDRALGIVHDQFSTLLVNGVPEGMRYVQI